MKRTSMVLMVIVLLIFAFLASLLVSPILIVAEDSEEDGGIDMAARKKITPDEYFAKESELPVLSGFTQVVQLMLKVKHYIMYVLIILMTHMVLPVIL